jgi:hypothetical protein
MFIPTQTPDLQQPLTQLLETKPVQPVSAVPGIPEDAQNLDSRVALQWTQPALPGEKGQTARSALAVPLAVQIVKPLNIKSFEPQGPDPDALRKGDVHPMLAEGLASWINAVVSKPAPNFRENAAPLQNALIRGMPSEPANEAPELDDSVPISKPIPMVVVNSTEAKPKELATQIKQASQQNETPVMPVLLSLYQALASSEIFAAQRLTESWLPRRVKPHLDTLDSDLPEKPNTQEARSSSANPNVVSLKMSQTQERFTDLAQPTSEPSIAQLTKWVSALEPDSEPAQQAAQMLTQGQMVWLADLAPGVPMRIVREDAWRNDLDRRDQLEKGAMLRVELNLPKLGRIRVVGSQWGQDLSLQIAHDASSQDQWTRLAPSLLNDLQTQVIGEVRFETLSEVEEGPNGQRTA